MSETITSARGGFLEFSPVKRDEDKENDFPILTLIQFSKAPFLTFGTVKLGTSKSAVLRVENPTEDAEAEVTVERIPSSKGFSLDHKTFTIQPEGSFNLTVTWTPTEEGGIRELIIFNANGILKHQAVMLGRAEAPKKKKKSLWDTIKQKREGEKEAAPRRKKTDQPLKMAANKTFQVPRKSQYKREKPRSPLSSLNEGKTVRERSPSEDSALYVHPQKPEEEKKLKNSTQTLRPLAVSDQENIYHVKRGSFHGPLIPAGKLVDCGNMLDSPDSLTGKAEHRDLTKILNRTLSPIGTPDKLKKLMPHIYSESPLSAAVKPAVDDADSILAGTPALSLKDALALIDSDLSQISTSPRDSSSSCGFSDSLESKAGKHVCGLDGNVLEALPDSPQPSGSSEPRLTFFVSKKMTSQVVVLEAAKAPENVKRASFTSATVIKSKAPAEANGSSGRKIKKSRRRLLEKTLELSEGSSRCESAPDTPGLPVIDAETKTWPNSECDDRHHAREFNSPSLVSQLDSSPPSFSLLVTSPPPVAPAHFSFSATSPTPAADASIALTITSLAPLGSSSPRHPASHPDVCQLFPPGPAPPSSQEDMFPIHIAAKSKKRKSEEYLKSDWKIEDAGKTASVKRSRVVAAKTLQERRNASQKMQTRKAGSTRSVTTSSLKSARPSVSAQGNKQTSRTASGVVYSQKSSGPSSLKAAKAAAVAQSKLTFIKPAQTAIPRHPMPFAAKNMFYDERWIEKQERGFTWWINYVLTPDDFKVNTEVAKVNAVSIVLGSGDKFSVHKAPTKEEMSFSTYTARRKLNRLRRSACQLFTSEAMAKAIQRLELEVEARRLLVRKDRHLWKDIGERRKVLNWLLSYNPLWLRIGLETIYGELISLESNSDAVGLAVFILQRLLWNPDIAVEYRHAKVPNLYKDGHEEALSRFTLKKLLLLVCFLDKAKESRLIEHNPCLFCLDAEFKTSKDLLLAFSRDFLSGEGILPRHLSYLGLPVSHAQAPLDEFNFAVKNLALDLRCGIRLARVMELLVQDWSLSAKLRLPAISRLQKIHNVDIALQVLRSKGLDLKDEHGSIIDSRDIVEGHREKTLGLLWKIIFAFHVEVILDEEQLREEIGFLKKTLRTKQQLAALKADQGFQSGLAKSRGPYENGSAKINLLMDWVRAVCDFYNLKVENFTVAFSDGRVLCYLIHRYHPGLLPEGAISQATTQTVECSQRGRLELNCSASDSDNSFDSFPTPELNVEFKELLENEKSNFRSVNAAVSFLGSVPAMINPADMSNTIPNEKVVVSYLSFLCARLLDLRNETRAARVIQGAWRKYRLKKDLQLYKERNVAAVKIQILVRSFLQRRRAKRQNEAALIIQSAWRGFLSRNRLRLKREAQLRSLRHEAATIIQAKWRMLSTMRAYQRLRYYAIVVQAQWRMRRAASAYGRMCWAATIFQKILRARALARKERQSYLSLRQAVVKIQRGYRQWKTRKVEKENGAARVIQAAIKKWYEEKMTERTVAAVRIQSWYRLQKCFKEYRKLKRSAVLVQALYRGQAQRRCFQILKLQHRSAVIIQCAFRGHAVRKRLAKIRCAAVIVQRRFRASVERDLERRMFVRLRFAAITLQAAYRGKVAREFLKTQHKAATAIQATFRKYAAKTRYLLLRQAAAVIQQRYRATALARITKRDYDALRNAAVSLQAGWRGRADRKQIEKWHHCATLIQANYRRHKAHAEYRRKKAAAEVLQDGYRAYVTGKETRKAYLQMRAACVTVQAGFRGMRVRKDLRKKHWAASVIQSSVRMFLCKKRYNLLHSTAIIIQCRYRALVVSRAHQKEFRRLKQATIKIQAVYRGFRVREDLKKRCDAATAIQAQYRMHRMRMTYLAARFAAIIIQERYRAKVLRDQQMQRYRTIKSAAVIIQAVYRGHMARRNMRDMENAATIIQRKFRTLRERKQFLAIKAAALVCQQRYRAATLARRDCLDYLSKRRAIICLQATYRGHCVRKQLFIQHQAALTIQSLFRKHCQRTRYKKLCWAARVLQTRYRANKRMREEMQVMTAKRNAAVVLQAAFRAMKSKRIFRRRHQAASIIQRAYRAHCEHKQYLSVMTSVLTIQRRYRAKVAAKEQIKQYQQMRRAAVILQAAHRGHTVRKEVTRWHQAATVIQSAFRRHREEVKFHAIRVSSVIIQRYYRAYILQRRERHTFLEMRQSATVLQAAYRGQMVRKEVACWHQAATVIQSAFRRHREEVKFQAMRLSAIIIQRYYRSCILQRHERKKYLTMRHSAIILQAAFRGHQVRRLMDNMHRAAIVMQANFKRHKQQSVFRRQRWAACVLQRRFRDHKQRDVDLKHYQDVRKAVINLQAAYRGLKSRRILKQRHQAASVIQRALRTHREREQYLALKSSVLTIQRRYRAKVEAKEQRQEYRKMRRAAVLLQAAHRGQTVRKEVTRWHRAATVIQSAFRRHREEVKFQAIRVSSVIIQRYYRSCILQRRERHTFLEMRQSATVLQAAYRGQMVRKEVACWHQAATVIQSAFRRHREEVKFQAMRLSAIIIQRYYRSCILQRHERRKYLTMRHSAIILQAAFRGRQVRRLMDNMHRAATVIQANFKRHKQQSVFRRQRWAACVLQRRFTAHKRRNVDLKHYQDVRKAVINLQAAYRGLKSRRILKQRHQAASVIQRALRTHREREQYLALKSSVLTIQRRYRAKVEAKEQRQEYRKMRRAAVLLQAAHRGQTVRKEVTRWHRAATVIQSAFRRHREEVKFQAIRVSSVIIQRYYRSCILQRRERHTFLEMRQSATVLQAAYRGQMVRKEVACWHQAATVIQSAFRRHREEVKFQAMRLSAIIIQRYYRSCILQRHERKKFLTVRHSAIILQAAFRGHQVRRLMDNMHRAATVIQANFKRHKQQSVFRRQRWAACVLQRRFTAHKRRNVDLKHYQDVRKAVINLQAAYRGLKSRRILKQRHQAASVIQRALRTHREREQYLALKSSVLTIQRRYRATIAAKEQTQEYRKMRRAAVLLQAAHRGQKVRKEVTRWHQAATVIQSAFRRHREEVKFQAIRLSAIIIQRYYRSCILQRHERKKFLTVRHSAIVLQGAFRGHQVRRHIANMHRAATVIQANFKRHKQQSVFRRQRWAACVLQRRFRDHKQRDVDLKHYQDVRKAVINLQAAYRGLKSRRILKQRHQAASVIQRALRTHREREQYLALKSSVLTIQRRYRAKVEAKEQRQEYQEMRRAAVLLQAAHRGQTVRKEVTRWHQAATVIQSAFRRHREEAKFQAMRLSAIIIQRYYRSCILQRHERKKYLTMRHSAIILQAAFRGWYVRRDLSCQNEAAIVIQSYWRCSVQRNIFQRKKGAVLKLQRRVRAVKLCKLERNSYIEMRKAAVILQTNWRAWMTRQKVLEAAREERRLRFAAAAFHHISAMKIQRALRAHWALESAKRQIHNVVTIQRWVKARQQRRRYLEDRRKVVLAQRTVKHWLANRHKAASIIQRGIRKFLLVRRQLGVQRGILKAQALWRGHRSRQLNDNPKLVKLRHRLRKVAANVQEEDKLCNKTSSALDYLLRYKHFSYILEALKNLEIATRLSPECCERLVESGATNVVFTLIRSCNRSVPCMDVITFSIQILLNLSKYHKTIEAVYSVGNSVETLLDLLQRYREKAGDKVAEKGGSIFTKACFLLALLLQDKRRAVEVMKSPKVLERIRSIYRLTARKHKMDAERSVVKQKMNASVNGSFYILATPRKSRPEPKFAPDWVLRKDKLKDIVDPLRAIQMVADTLSIVL